MSAPFTASAYEALPAGVYPAVLLGIEKGTSEQFGDFLKWSFNVRTADGGEAPLSAVSSISTGPKSKAYKWAAAMLGRNPAAGQPEDLEGLTCQLHVTVNEEGFNRIESVLPLASTAPPRTAPPAMDAPPARLAPAVSAAAFDVAPVSADLPF